MKAVFQERPALPKYSVVWDPDIVLAYIKGLGVNRRLSILQLSRKLVILMLLQSGQRGQTLHMLDVRNMVLTFSKVTFGIGEPLKTSGPGQHLSEVRFGAYAPHRSLCVVTALKVYLKRTLDVRGTVQKLFLATRPPVRAASRATLRRWAKEVLVAAGIDMKIFAPSSTRAASVSKASLRLSTATIIRTVGWSSDSVFGKFYKNP